MPTDIEQLREQVELKRLREAVEAKRQSATPPAGPSDAQLSGYAFLQSHPEGKKALNQAKDILDNPLNILSYPGNLVKAGADALLSRNPNDTLENNVNRLNTMDPAYFPGDAAAERLASSPLGRAAVKTAMDVGLDPFTYAGAAAGKGIEAVEAEHDPGMFLRGANKVASFLTGGRIGPKWAESAKALTPMEQIHSGATLDEASRAYGPMKTAADTVMSGRESPLADTLFSPAHRENAPEAFSTLDRAVQRLDDAVNKLKRMKSAIPDTAQSVLDRAKEIQFRGATSGPETAELMDAINDIEYTGFSNPRMIKKILQGPQAEMRGALQDLTAASSPEYSAARQKVADAINVNAPPQGGLMSKNLLQRAPMMAGAIGAGEEAAQGKFGAAVNTALATALVGNPAAWNVATGVARIPADLASQGTEAVSTYLASHPNEAAAIGAALPNLLKGSPEQAATGLDAYINTPVAAPAPPPPPDPRQPIKAALGAAGEPFINTAEAKPAIYAKLAQYAAQNGHPQVAPFFQAASEMGVVGAMQQYTAMYPTVWPMMQAVLPAITMEAIKASPEIQSDMRRGIENSGDKDALTKAQMIGQINDKSLFNLPKP